MTQGADLLTERFTPAIPTGIVAEHDRVAQTRAAPGIRWQLPQVDSATLSRYYRYLRRQLVLPFLARYPAAMNSREEREHLCTVIELIDPAGGVGDAFDGIFCRVCKGKHEVVLPLIELELAPDDPSYEVIENYWHWFWRWR